MSASTQKYKTIVKPLVTEKALGLREQANQYVFMAKLDANKLSIKQAIEDLFKVNVLDVRSMRVRGKVRRQGRNVGKKSNWKKVLVRLKEGDSIELFEGV